MDHAELILACTLDPALVRERVEDWKQAVADARAREPLPHGMRLRFAAGHPAAQLADLVQAERACCPFFDFAITIDDEGIALDVTAPAEARPLVDILLGLDEGAATPPRG